MLSLTGIRIWLSGAVPKEATADQAKNIKTFAITLGRQAFESGAPIVHGAHLSITKHLLAEAERHQVNTGEKAPRSPRSDGDLKRRFPQG